jgi:hypothetical protein
MVVNLDNSFRLKWNEFLQVFIKSFPLAFFQPQALPPAFSRILKQNPSRKHPPLP